MSSTNATLILAPLSALYEMVTRARGALYRRGYIQIKRVEAPVISVGNITTGGTGKTPLVEWVARSLARDGLRVCILTRGYGRAGSPRHRVVVSDGEQLLADAFEGGDEPRLLAESLMGEAAIVSDSDRVAAALWALEHLQSEVFILDDGFQHMRIHRDLDIVTIDATDPLGGGRLLPSGRLRENAGGLRRAGLIVITRAGQSTDITGLRGKLSRLSSERPIIISETRTRRVRPLTPDSTASPAPDGPSLKIAAAFCGIGNPRAFFAHLESEGYPLAHTRAFPDHHHYTQADISELSEKAKLAGAQLLITTAKDAVKLGVLTFELPCYVLEIELAFDDEEQLRRMIRDAVHKSKRPE